MYFFIFLLCFVSCTASFDATRQEETSEEAGEEAREEAGEETSEETSEEEREEASEEASVKADQLFDMAFGFARGFVQDDFNLPGYNLTFDSGYLGKANLRLFDGRVDSLHSMKRIGQSNMTNSDDGTKLETHVVFTNLTGFYAAKADFWRFNFLGNSTVTIGTTTFKLNADIIGDRNLKIKLSDLVVVGVDDVRVDFNGLGALDSFIDKASSFFMDQLEEDFLTLLQPFVFEAVHDHLISFDVPYLYGGILKSMLE